MKGKNCSILWNTHTLFLRASVSFEKFASLYTRSLSVRNQISPLFWHWWRIAYYDSAYQESCHTQQEVWFEHIYVPRWLNLILSIVISPDCEWKAQAGNICVASFDWSCSGICRSVDRIKEVHRRCGEGENALWNASFWQNTSFLQSLEAPITITQTLWKNKMYLRIHRNVSRKGESGYHCICSKYY